MAHVPMLVKRNNNCIATVEGLQRHGAYNMPERLTLSNIVYPYRHIFIYLYSGCAVAASERTTWKNGKKYSAAMSK